jgi:hypothetical protein
LGLDRQASLQAAKPAMQKFRLAFHSVSNQMPIQAKGELSQKGTFLEN